RCYLLYERPRRPLCWVNVGLTALRKFAGNHTPHSIGAMRITIKPVTVGSCGVLYAGADRLCYSFHNSPLARHRPLRTTASRIRRALSDWRSRGGALVCRDTWLKLPGVSRTVAGGETGYSQMDQYEHRPRRLRAQFDPRVSPGLLVRRSLHCRSSGRSRFGRVVEHPLERAHWHAQKAADPHRGDFATGGSRICCVAAHTKVVSAGFRDRHGERLVVLTHQTFTPSIEWDHLLVPCIHKWH